MILVRNYVNGIFVDSKETIEDINPATSEVIATIPRSNLNDVNEAVLAADKARDNWSSLSLDERRKWLEKIANALEARSEEIAKLESLDTGKPIKIARAVDASRSVANFRFFAEFSKDFHEQKFLMEDASNHVIFKPVGIAGLITPWNLPLYLLSWKIAPAIVMGNTVVAKPSELTPLTANLLAEVFDEVGVHEERRHRRQHADEGDPGADRVDFADCGQVDLGYLPVQRAQIVIDLADRGHQEGSRQDEHIAPVIPFDQLIFGNTTHCGRV